MAAERDEAARARWRQERAEEAAAGRFDASRLIFIDESGFKRAMTRLYARAPRGVRVEGRLPTRGGAARRCLSVAGALWAGGILASRAIAESFNAERFLAFIVEDLVPKLRAGDVVLMDNLNVHHRAAVRQAIEAAGARVLFLPAYSPDFNPIEKAWSKVKALVRGALDRAAERTEAALRAAVAAALAAINVYDAESWFNHCGYEFE